MRLRWSLADPLRALLAVEAVAMVSSYVLDVIYATMHINGSPSDVKSLIIYSAEFFVAAFALFSIPHQPNRRYVAIAVALCAVPIMVLQPTGALGPVVFLVVLAARLTFAFGFRGTAIAWLVAFASIMFDPVMAYVTAPTFKHGTNILASAIFTLVLSTLLYGVVGIMWLYARQGAAAAAAAERNRIALDLHDSLGHALTTLGVHLENANRLALADPRKAKSYMTRAGELTSELLADLRETVAILHDTQSTQSPPVVGLLDRLRSDFAATHAVDLYWRVSLDREPVGRSAHVLYRVVQEALTNVARHSQARQVTVEIRGDKHTLSISVEDNGRGFTTASEGGHGIKSMRSRVESIAGTIDIASSQGAGTRIQATFPLESAS